MTSHRGISLITLLLLASMASATCQTGWDYCATFTPDYVIPPDGGSTFTDLNLTAIFCTAGGPTTTYASSIIQDNIYGQCEVEDPDDGIGNNLTSVYANFTGVCELQGNILTTPDDGHLVLNVTNTGLTGCYSTALVSVTMCLNGTASKTQSYGHTAGYDFNVSMPITDTMFTQYYHRLWTFYTDSGVLANFTNKSAIMTVTCPTYSLLSKNLSTLAYGATMDIQTIEQPSFSVNNNGLIRTRVEADHWLDDRYYTMTGVAGSSQTQYTFTLLDYTGQCLGPISVLSSIGDRLDIIASASFDPNRIAYLWLDNATGYDIRVGCNNNGLRDYGTWTLGATQSRNIEVTNVPIMPAATVYDGGFVPSFTGNGTNTIIFLYTKTSGVVSSINYTIQDISVTPASVVSTNILTNTGSGQINYNMENGTYYATMVAVNNGQTINLANVFIPMRLNATSTTLPSTILGSDSNWIYKTGALIGMVVIGLSWAAIDAGYGSLIMVAWILLMANAPRFDGVSGWISVPSWLQVTIGLMALGLLWGMNRRHDE